MLIPRAERGKKTEALLSINHAVRLSKRCREAKPSNVIEQSWATVPFSCPNSHFQSFRNGRLDVALISPDGILIPADTSFCLLLVCLLNADWILYETPSWHRWQKNDPICQRYGKDTHKCQHRICKSEVSNAKQSKAPAKSLLKPTKLKSHSRAIKTALRSHRW